MLYRFTWLLLAVVTFGIEAHGKTLSLKVKDNVTSLIAQGDVTQSDVSTTAAAAAAASGQTVHNLDKTIDESRTSSAVQDWSLVCQQLCG